MANGSGPVGWMDQCFETRYGAEEGMMLRALMHALCMLKQQAGARLRPLLSLPMPITETAVHAAAFAYFNNA